jgi:alkylation response protein AidB-like acyl-CoA dehydrogenase
LIPYANGDKKAAIAITEPAAGSDPANMQMPAEYRNGKWVLNGVSRDMPIEYMARACRVWRIFEGPSEVHRWFITRDLLRNGMPAA